MALKVVKRDGSLEDFDQNKIARVVTAAGLDPEAAYKLAEAVAVWAKSLGQNQITTATLRDKVVEELQKVNKYAANLFVWYEKTKDKDQLDH